MPALMHRGTEGMREDLQPGREVFSVYFHVLCHRQNPDSQNCNCARGDACFRGTACTAPAVQLLDMQMLKTGILKVDKLASSYTCALQVR